MCGYAQNATSTTQWRHLSWAPWLLLCQHPDIFCRHLAKLLVLLSALINMWKLSLTCLVGNVTAELSLCELSPLAFQSNEPGDFTFVSEAKVQTSVTSRHSCIKKSDLTGIWVTNEALFITAKYSFHCRNHYKEPKTAPRCSTPLK